MKNINIIKVYLFLFLVLILIQILYWQKYSKIESEIEIVATPPNEKTIKAFTFGDNEFYFRLKCFKVQNMGDTFGKFTSLIKYDYNKLFAWFYELEKLNYQSNYLPALSAYYFSQTPNKQDKLYTVYFLKQHALKNIEKKWWWLYQASYIANYGIGDKKLAIELATILKNLNLKNIPFWVKQTSNIFLSQWNDSCEAVRIISEIMNEIENNLSNKDKETELNYMKFFLNKELKKIEKYDNFDIKKCFNK